MRVLRRLIVHHSASPLSWTLEDLERVHVEERGWRALGYNYVIEADGQLRVGRPLWEIGAHARGHNRDSIGICAIGDNTHAGRGWTPPQMLSLQRFIISARLLIPDLEILGHRDVMPSGYTECPGIDVAELLAALLPRSV